MLHTVYLAGLCSRRNWSDPCYQTTLTRNGYTCVVRVNNREYQTSKHYDSEMAAREAAATTAYTICRSFSVNDGMYPTGFGHSGVIQGAPVPVGSGRRHRTSPPTTATYRYRGDSDSSSRSDSSSQRSGDSSPELSQDPRMSQMRRMTPMDMTPPSQMYSCASSTREKPRYGRFTMGRRH